MGTRPLSNIQTRRYFWLSIIERTRAEEGFFGGLLKPKHAVTSKGFICPKSTPFSDALALEIEDNPRMQYHSRSPLQVNP